MKIVNYLLLLFLCPVFLFGQRIVSDRVQKAETKLPKVNYSLVNASSQSLKDAGIPENVLSEGILVNLNQASIRTLLNTRPELLELRFPLPGLGETSVTLIPNKVLTSDFILRTSDGRTLDYQPGLYYYGTVTNDPSTLVAISIFDQEIHGMISTDRGNFVIGKLEEPGSEQHLIYNDRAYKQSFDLDCGTEDDGVGYKPSQLEFDATKAVGDCIRVYVEIDDDVVTNKGGATGATNYITGLFNQTITLYANESLNMVVSEIKAWTTPAPYSGTSSSAMLSSYQANTGTFNGDLSHLVSYQASGGIAAGFAGICATNPDNSKCFSSIDASYSNVPTYSFSVMVVTHEMGHLIGSRHTHACVWNGNNTAIDGCAGGVEGGCALPGSPSGGGTIMSYCHLTTGINFNLGFGAQPGAVIRNTVANASCLAPCGGGGGPTCTDGVQNGTETGVDCGGSSCPACPTACNDNPVTISITFDNYPEETSWTVTNASGSVVASGGTYGAQPDGSTLVQNLCLVNGCYNFNIFDAYGDGMCCTYGNGSYTVSAGGSTVASGGSFTTSQSTNFCVGAAAPTCTDGIQNGDETGVDCGGSTCPSCPTGGSQVLLGSYFETGFDGWSDGGADCARYAGTYSYEGTYSIQLRDNSGTASAMTSGSFNVTSFNQLEIKFYFYANSMETGEDFWVRYYNGSTWQTVATYARGTSFNNNTFYTATVTLNTSQVAFPSNAQFRFQCDASADNDQVYIDQVTITGISGALIEAGPIATSITLLGDATATESEISVSPAVFNQGVDVVPGQVLVFPNPVADVLNVRADGEMQSIRLLSATGQVLRQIPMASEQTTLDIADLNPGMYYLLIEVNGGLIPQRFVKQ
ncbi:MAG: hypothetical protein DA408_00965 [Bacteroidetes bacterium]|nr:MAG: hypothetical protein DA408_00965 [Bacteroidota bacterium]